MAPSLSDKEDNLVTCNAIFSGMIVALNRPRKLNSLNYKLIVQMLKIFKAYENDPTIKFVILKMACVAPRSHGGDAGGDPPRRPTRHVPAQCQSSHQRFQTGNARLRRAYRDNKERPLTLGFDFQDLKTFHPLGDYASLLSHLMGELVWILPLACDWDEIPDSSKAHILPTLETYFDLATWFNNQNPVVYGNNVYTVGERVRLGLELQLRLLYRKYKNRIKNQYYTVHETPEEARRHMPPQNTWGHRTQDDWDDLVEWLSHPERVTRSEINTVNRSKNTVPTTQGKKSFAQGRNQYKVKEGRYEDLVETWRKGHSHNGTFKDKANEERYLKMKALQDQVRAKTTTYMTDKEIVAHIMPSQNKQNVSGMGRKLPGGGSTSRRRGPPAGPDNVTRDELHQLMEQHAQEMEMMRKQTQEAQQRAYLAGLKADAAQQWGQTSYQNVTQYQTALGEFFQNFNSSNTAHPFTPPSFNLVPPPQPSFMPPLAPDWAHLVQPPFPFNQPFQPPFTDPSRPPFPGHLQPLQPPYAGTLPMTPLTNNTFNYCYRPVINSPHDIGSTSTSQLGGSRLIMNPHMNDYRSVDELGRDRDLQNSGDDLSGDDEQQDDPNDFSDEEVEDDN